MASWTPYSSLTSVTSTSTLFVLSLVFSRTETSNLSTLLSRQASSRRTGAFGSRKSGTLIRAGLMRSLLAEPFLKVWGAWGCSFSDEFRLFTVQSGVWSKPRSLSQRIVVSLGKSTLDSSHVHLSHSECKRYRGSQARGLHTSTLVGSSASSSKALLVRCVAR